VLVRGHPAYYRRFGFSPEPMAALKTPWDGPHMQALALTARGRSAAGSVIYPPAFAALL
jgi:putative acetyltransferase